MAKEEINKKKSFEGIGGGFHLTFGNGLTLSTQFKSGNYCDNYDNLDFNNNKVFKSNTCEVAIWDENKDNEFVTSKILGIDDDVKGWVSINEWYDIVKKCKNYK